MTDESCLKSDVRGKKTMARFWIVLPGVERGPGLVGWIRQMMREGQTLNAVDDAGTQLKVGRGEMQVELVVAGWRK